VVGFGEVVFSGETVVLMTTKSGRVRTRASGQVSEQERKGERERESGRVCER